MNARLLRLLPRTLAAALIVCAVAPHTALAQSPEGAYRQIRSFDFASGEAPRGRLWALPDGSFVGTAHSAGRGYGTVYLLKPGNRSFEVLHSFEGEPDDGDGPLAGVVADSHGNLWGTTFQGGTAREGTIYRITAPDKYELVHVFGQGAGAGAFPIGELALASDGSLYGTTNGGGSGGLGTVFRLSTDGSVTTIWDLAPGEPAAPRGRLLQASDGLLYGTSQGGSTTCCGTVFSLALDGSGHRILHSFSDGDGAIPAGGVIEASDGRLYGTTARGGAQEMGVIYRVDRDGSNFTVLHTFLDSHDGAGPFGELVETSPGVFVGTTSMGGKGRIDAGTIFQILASGEFTVLYRFTGMRASRGYVDGRWPYATLTPAADGTLLGVTSNGGGFRGGTVFKITAP
jgi:uncharacterized repeat protein (TIGR03803 family)